MNAPWWIDLIVTLAMFAVGIGKGVSIAMLGHSFARWLELVGWLGLVGRFTVGLVMDGDVPVNSVALLFLLMIAGGRLENIYRQVQAERVKLFCFRDPELRCNREDRIRMELIRRHEP